MLAQHVLTIANNRAAIAELADAFDAFCRDNDVPPAVVYPVQVAIDELLTNTITYGYPEESASSIDVYIYLTDSVLEVVLVDDADPFNPLEREAPDTEAALEDRPIGGLGIHLVTQLMDAVEYRRKDGRNYIHLRRQIPKDTS